MDKHDAAALTAGIAIVVVGVTYIVMNIINCNAAGGTLVRGMWGLECMKGCFK